MYKIKTVIDKGMMAMETKDFELFCEKEKLPIFIGDSKLGRFTVFNGFMFVDWK